MGMCFGVKAAIESAKQLASRRNVTILGELAHNARVRESLEKLGAKHGSLADDKATTNDVIITAHGTSDTMRTKWQNLGYRVTDTTCPLVHKTHAALSQLVASGYTPLVIGKADHVEARGLMGDFPTAQAVLTVHDVHELKLDTPSRGTRLKIGVVSQTTQQITHCEKIILAIKKKFPHTEVKFIDTVCRPTKQRQSAIEDLCTKAKLIIVVGGANSNNTAQLARKCEQLGCISYHVQSPQDLRPEWFAATRRVGLTAGTSTPDELITQVKKKLLEISRS